MKGKVAALLMAAMLMLTGCDYIQPNAENLIKPPKLNAEQQEVYDALIQQVGKDIKLVYPDSGTNRGPFVITDIDGDQKDEALVFYTDSKGDNVRINLMDQQDGKWQVLYDMSGESANIDFVDFANLYSASSKVVIIGFRLVDEMNKILQVYDFTGPNPTEVRYKDHYSEMAIVDFDDDHLSELLLVNQNAAEKTASARLIRLDGSELAEISRVPMDGNITGYSELTIGRMDESTNAVFIDEKKATGMTTEVLIWKDQMLQNLIYNDENNLVQTTYRSQAVNSRDIDADGMIEIPSSQPVNKVDPPTNAKEDNSVPITTWNKVKNGQLEPVFDQVISLQYGFAFTYPTKWMDKVEAMNRVDTKEVVFYLPAKSPGGDITELLRLRVVTKEDKEKGDFDLAEYSLYELIYVRGQTEYTFYAPVFTEEADMLLKNEEIKSLFSFVDDRK